MKVFSSFVVVVLFAAATSTALEHGDDGKAAATASTSIRRSLGHLDLGGPPGNGSWRNNGSSNNNNGNGNNNANNNGHGSIPDLLNGYNNNDGNTAIEEEAGTIINNDNGNNNAGGVGPTYIRPPELNECQDRERKTNIPMMENCTRCDECRNGECLTFYVDDQRYSDLRQYLTSDDEIGTCQPYICSDNDDCEFGECRSGVGNTWYGLSGECSECTVDNNCYGDEICSSGGSCYCPLLPEDDWTRMEGETCSYSCYEYLFNEDTGLNNQRGECNLATCLGGCKEGVCIAPGICTFYDIGVGCDEDKECASGDCLHDVRVNPFDGVCQCNTNAHCPDGESCVYGLPNRCGPTNIPDGEACEDSVDCVSECCIQTLLGDHTCGQNQVWNNCLGI